MAETKDHAARALQMAAYVALVAWGIKTASLILSILLISLLLAYVILPLPKWLMRRLHLNKGLAITLTVAFVITLYSVISLAFLEAGLQMRAKLPLYEVHLRGVLEHLEAFLRARGIQSASLSYKSWYSSEKIIEFARTVVPRVVGLISDRFMIALLSLFFVIEMADPDEVKSSPLARGFAHLSGDVRRFIVISAQTGAINALANLVLLVLLGVDFALIWCVLYFFLHFIPNFGFLVSVIPPTLVALLMLGWKRALLVLGALILTEMLGDYVVKSMLMIKGLHISLLQITLSLMVWGYLLGAAGAILAIPLTLALRKFLEGPLTPGRPPLAVKELSLQETKLQPAVASGATFW